MLQINDSWFVTRDKNNWILNHVEWRTAKTGKHEGERVRDITQSYYSNLESLCLRCIDKSLDPTGGFAGLLRQLEVAKTDLCKMIKKHDLEIRRTIKEVGK